MDLREQTGQGKRSNEMVVGTWDVSSLKWAGSLRNLENGFQGLEKNS
jgi:hypothetical protein